jgi:hypothetical protein
MAALPPVDAAVGALEDLVAGGVAAW